MARQNAHTLYKDIDYSYINGTDASIQPEREEQLRGLLHIVATQIPDKIVWSVMNKFTETKSRRCQSIIKKINFHRTKRTLVKWLKQYTFEFIHEVDTGYKEFYISGCIADIICDDKGYDSGGILAPQSGAYDFLLTLNVLNDEGTELIEIFDEDGESWSGDDSSDQSEEEDPN